MSNYSTGFTVTAKARIAKLIGVKSVSTNLRSVTRVVVIANNYRGHQNQAGEKIYEPTSMLVDFKNLSNHQVNNLRVGNLIEFDGEILENTYKVGDETRSYHAIQSWEYTTIRHPRDGQRETQEWLKGRQDFEDPENYSDDTACTSEGEFSLDDIPF